MNLMWFRSDLRIYDNPALHAAMASGPTIAVYCLNQSQWRHHDISSAKSSLIIRQLMDLADSLAQLHVPFFILDTAEFSAVPAAIKGLCSEQGVTHVFANQEHELNEIKCTEQAYNALSELTPSVPLLQYLDQCLVKPGSILNKQGGMFKVFSAFKRAFLSQYQDLVRPLAQLPKAQAPLNIVVPEQQSITQLKQVKFENDCQQYWPAGESVAHEYLNQFVENRVVNYADERDIPSLNGTSGLSPYLAVGAISTRQCMQVLLNARNGDPKGGLDVWRNEIIWREFYRHLLEANPQLCRHLPFKSDTDALPWKKDEQVLTAWQQGLTGFPLVDAAMAQLNETGWMHNRLRMVVAMFFTKHLFMDWRLGERYFMSKLVDGDFASNNGGWQWSASTGVDAVPYFRIFNPVRQSQRFDESGEFIRRYVPKLAALNNKDIHMPSAKQAQELGYPLPLVNHADAVAQCKFYFKQLAVNPDGIQSVVDFPIQNTMAL